MHHKQYNGTSVIALRGRRWRPAAATGVVAAAPATASAFGTALLAACGSCLGLGTAAAGAGASAAAAAGTGAAAASVQASAPTGPSGWQLAFALAAFAVLVLWQSRRAWRATACAAGRERIRQVSMRLVPHLLVAAASFAAVQLLVVPWLAAPLPEAAPVLP
jgi:hypothetical protein